MEEPWYVYLLLVPATLLAWWVYYKVHVEPYRKRRRK
jgi:hypothetical protein